MHYLLVLYVFENGFQFKRKKPQKPKKITVKMWQRATASNEIQDCEAVQVWEIIFWSRDPQRTAGYIRITQRASQNADSWAQRLEVDFLHLGKGLEICILEKLVIL